MTTKQRLELLAHQFRTWDVLASVGFAIMLVLFLLAGFVEVRL